LFALRSHQRGGCTGPGGPVKKNSPVHKGKKNPIAKVIKHDRFFEGVGEKSRIRCPISDKKETRNYPPATTRHLKGLSVKERTRGKKKLPAGREGERWSLYHQGKRRNQKKGSCIIQGTPPGGANNKRKRSIRKQPPDQWGLAQQLCRLGLKKRT